MSELASDGGATSRRPRRGTDPVRLVDDGKRILFWPSGVVGHGNRKWKRTTPETSAADVQRIRADLARKARFDPSEQRPLVDAMRAFVAHLEATGTPTGTTRQYRSNWNKWVPTQVRETPCCDLEWRHWTLIFDGLLMGGASVSTVRSVARTMGSLLQFAVARGYFEVQEPFTTEARRKATVRSTLAAAEKQSNRHRGSTPLTWCPTHYEVQRLADSLEAFYPRYGERLVLLSYASGVRIAEALALRMEAAHLEPDRTRLEVLAQLDRTRPWPAVCAPKGSRARETIVWRAYRPVLESLVRDANEETGSAHGWLFPPVRPVRDWTRLMSDLFAAAAEDCGFSWRHHSLRHAFASVCMAPASSGGYGLDPASVQRWLGHRQLSTTFDHYVAPQADDMAVAHLRTAAMPTQGFAGSSHD